MAETRGRKLMLLGITLAGLGVALFALFNGSGADPGSTGSRGDHAEAPAAMVADRGADANARVAIRDAAAGAEVAARSGATAPAQFRLVRRVSYSEQRGNYFGPCEVRDEGARLASWQQLKAQEHPLTFTLPVASTRVSFHSQGFKPIECDVPPMREGIHDFGTLVLEPDAAVRVQVRVPAGWRGHIECELDLPAIEYFFDSKQVEAQAGGAEAVLPVPSGYEVSLSVEARDGVPFVFHSSPPRFQLASGETRLCEFDVGAMPAHTIRVVGPSAELLPNLTIMCSVEKNRIGGIVHPDAEGRAVLRGYEPSQLFYMLRCHGWGMLHAREGAAGPDFEIEPDSPIAGVALRNEAGRRVPFVLGYEPDSDKSLDYVGKDSGLLVQVFFATELQKATTWLAWSESLGALRWPAGAIVWHRDVGELDINTAQQRAGLVVVGAGEKPKETRKFAVELLDAKGQSAAVRQGVEDRYVFADIVPGEYSVRWRIGKEPGPQIADKIKLSPGVPKQLDASWPVTVLWHGEVTNWNAIPAADRLRLVWIGAGWAMVDDAGHFECPVLDGAEPPQQVRFSTRSGQRDGRVTSVDVAGHRVLVEHPTDLRWVNLRVVPRFGHDWRVVLYAEKREDIWAMVSPLLTRLLMPPTGVLRGWLAEEDAGKPLANITAWVAIDGSQPEVELKPGGGHWCDLRLERSNARMQTYLLSPEGQPSGSYERQERPGTQRIWIPDGTRSVQIELDPGGKQLLDATQNELVVR